MVEFPELIPGLPEEIALECLTRLHSTTHPVAARVCKRWRQLLQSTHFYIHRKQTGYTLKAACLVQALPLHSGSDAVKPVASSRYGVTVFDPLSRTWNRIDPVPKYPTGLPLFCRVSSSQGKLVVMGGWDPVSYSPVSDVFLYDFTTQSWSQGKHMPENRSFFAAGELNGRVIIAGGHDDSKNALNTAWEYDVSKDEWTELPRMSQERDECEGVVIGSDFWVVSGYKTESQGSFEGSAESYKVGRAEWKRVEEAWRVSQCPRSCLGVAEDSKLFSWTESESEPVPGVQVGTCRVQLGESTFVSGSAYQGGPQEFYLKEGQTGKFNKLDVPDEFRLFIQSGCCVEI
ncbi:hypothetical protein JRO89_XS12G0139500 [Xanthoceras sorbifolium]|uniref:F-box domain-containing protein n=1 Tax=Xanthoceras sorbifolium TaxID=99658 RepID=A0ABQ8HCK7_9ROSI|nr:hypothetical protein JRO89_XS12G0139500 [Xanthoceras sorbifolium]